MPPCDLTKRGKYNTQLSWHITETEEALLNASNLSNQAQTVYNKITHPRKRREWLAARLTLKRLLTGLGHEYTELQKDAWGRPYLLNSNLHLSIAHNFPFAFAAVDQQHPIGIDVQSPCNKLQKIKEKFLDNEEIKDSGNNLEKLCLYWCAKEVLYKLQGGRNLSLKRDIRIGAFTESDQGTLWGEVSSQLFAIHYNFYAGYVFAWSSEEKRT